LRAPFGNTHFMDRDRAIETLRQHADELRALGVTNVALFGSIAPSTCSTQLPEWNV
jgi:predicted nucleotidyltransferase